MSDPFLLMLAEHTRLGAIPEKDAAILKSFYDSYAKALIECGLSKEACRASFETYLQKIEELILHPYHFPPYHKQIRAPFDYYAFGLDLVRPLIDKKISSIKGFAHVEKILALLQKGDNVVFFANHQTEADPQAIGVLMEDLCPSLGEQMIFVAGERVITDPLAVPLSLGCNLLCIFSKRYIDHPPEQKMQKQLHNKKTMELMSLLLREGGKAIYVAPSGGRDRADAKGVVKVAPFDPQSLEMFYLMAQKAGRPTHFYPMALATYNLLPPPETIQRELGEQRLAKRGAVHIGFGPEIQMENFQGMEKGNKHLLRKARAEYIWKLVYEDYIKLQE